MNEKNIKSEISRRQFIKSASAVAAAVALARTSAKTVIAGTGANERLGIGFIGVGGRGSSHVETVKGLMENKNEAVDIVAFCDAYRPHMQKHLDVYKNAKGYMDYRELLADPKVDVVCIATPDHHHGYQAIDAVKAGKDVYCEKPITHWRQFELTKRLAKTVTESNSVFQAGTQALSDSVWHQMKKLVQDGLIGRPIHAECGYFREGDWGERGMPIDDRNAKPGADLNWEAFLGDAPKRPFDVSRFFRWRMYEDYAGGPATDLFPHSLAPVLHILGVKFPSMVVATGGKFRYQEREVPDTYNTLIDYPEKITVAVLGTQGSSHPGTGGRGAGNRLPVIRGWDGALTVKAKTNEIEFNPNDGYGVTKTGKKTQFFPIEHG